MTELIKISSELTLRKIHYRDAEAIFGIIDNDREHLRVWLPFVDLTHNADSTRTFIDQLNSVHSREFVFTIWYYDQITGLIGFKDIDRINKRLEIGYWITSANEGKGLVTASCNALIDLAFRKMDMNRVQIKCGVGNERSSNIPKRLGFVFEGIERHGEKHFNRFIDLEVYSILKAEWGN